MARQARARQARPASATEKADGLTARRPSLEELLPSRKLRQVFDETAASLEAARFLRRVREAAGLQQADVAKALGVSQARISAIESGKGRDGPSYALIRRYLAACGRDFSLELGLLSPIAVTAAETAAEAAGLPVPLHVVEDVVDASGQFVGVIGTVDMVETFPAAKAWRDLVGLRFFVGRESMKSAGGLPAIRGPAIKERLASKARVKERG